MKKSLVALAALAATSAFAQSSVTVYGIVDQAYQTNNQNSRDGSLYQNYRGFGEGAMAGSRIGFRGTEDLGGGLKANFVIEQGIAISQADAFNYRKTGDGIDVPQNSVTGANRQSFVGLESASLGSIKMGRIYASTYDMYTNNGMIIAEAAGNGQATWGVDTRIKGAQYSTPSFNGVVLSLFKGGKNDDGINYTSTEDQINGYKSKKADYTAYRVMWVQGPAKVGYSYEKADMDQTPNAAAYANYFTNSAKIITAPVAADNDTAYSLKTSTLVGSYNFGPVELIGLWGKADRGNAKDTSISNEKFKQIGAKVPFGGGWEAQLNYFTKKATKDTTGVDSVDQKGNFVNVNYSLSKRTRAYIAMGSQKDEAGTASAAVTQEIKRNFIGVIHTF